MFHPPLTDHVSRPFLTFCRTYHLFFVRVVGDPAVPSRVLPVRLRLPKRQVHGDGDAHQTKTPRPPQGNMTRLHLLHVSPAGHTPVQRRPSSSCRCYLRVISTEALLCILVFCVFSLYVCHQESICLGLPAGAPGMREVTPAKTLQQLAKIWDAEADYDAELARYITEEHSLPAACIHSFLYVAPRWLITSYQGR